MRTREILHILSKSVITRRYLGGVFPRDQLPLHRIQDMPVYYVVNTDPRDRPGKHWLLIFIDRDHTVEFYDSLGRCPDPTIGIYTDFY